MSMLAVPGGPPRAAGIASGATLPHRAPHGTIRVHRLTRQRKDPRCRPNSSTRPPAAQAAIAPPVRKVTSAEGGYVIIGKRLSTADRAQVPGIGDGEDAVWVPTT